MSLSPREWSITVGERAIPSTSDVGNLKTNWPVCASKTRCGGLCQTSMRRVSRRASTLVKPPEKKSVREMTILPVDLYFMVM